METRCIIRERRNVGVFLNQNMNSLDRSLNRRLPTLVTVFLVLQPLLDMAGFWQEQLGIKLVLTTAIRFGCFGGVMMIGFFMSERKGIYIALGGVMGAFALARSVALMEAGYSFPGEDLKNLLTFYMLPCYSLAFCTICNRNPKAVGAVFRGCVWNLGIIGIVMVLSRLTGTDHYTYPNKELGVQGWFLYGNPQSAILSMIVPVAMGWALHTWKREWLPVACTVLVGEACLYALGTRLSTMALAASGLGMGICLMLIDRKRWHQSVAILAVTAVFVALIPLSPMVENQSRQGDNFLAKQEAFDAVAQTEPEATPEEELDHLVEAYRLYVPGLITRFGGERTLEAYGYTTDVNVVAARRTMRRTFCKLLQEDSPTSAKWFGMDITRMKVEGEDLNWTTGEREYMVTSFDPENDFHAVYYLYGAVGLALILAFFAWFAGTALWAMIRDWTGRFDVRFAALAIACCCALAHCVFTASILRFINSQCYLAPILGALWSFSRKGLPQQTQKKEA